MTISFIKEIDVGGSRAVQDDVGGSRAVQGRDEKRIKSLVGKLVMKLRHTPGEIILKWI